MFDWRQPPAAAPFLGSRALWQPKRVPRTDRGWPTRSEEKASDPAELLDTREHDVACEVAREQAVSGRATKTPLGTLARFIRSALRRVQ